MTAISLGDSVEDIIFIPWKFSKKFNNFFSTVIIIGYSLGSLNNYFNKKGVPGLGSTTLPQSTVDIKEDASITGRDDNDVLLQRIQEKISCCVPRIQQQ